MPVAWQPRNKTRWSPVGRTQTHQDYYCVRAASADFSGYWAPQVDPDGVTRNRMSYTEHAAYIETVADEVAFIRSLPTGRIIDFGAGPGWFLGAFPEWERLGIEVADDAVAALHETGISHAYSLDDVADCWADVTVCYHVIEHMTDPEDVIAELRRTLRPGGHLILGTPDFDSPCAQRFGDRYRMLHDATHCSLFSLESMHRFLRDHGFEIDDVTFPFPAKYATAETMDRWNDTTQVSPPWPGNWMTFYCRRSNG